MKPLMMEFHEGSAKAAKSVRSSRSEGLQLSSKNELSMLSIGLKHSIAHVLLSFDLH